MATQEANSANSYGK